MSLKAAAFCLSQVTPVGISAACSIPAKIIYHQQNRPHTASHTTEFNRNYCTKMVDVNTCSYLGQDEAAKIDEELFSKYGFKVEQLMELAGLAAAQAVHQHFPGKGNALVLCGPGNNGGDGFVCARHLQMFGFSPSIVYPKESRNDLMRSLVVQCQGMEIPVSRQLPSDLNGFDMIVDAFFGFSFKPPVREPFAEMISQVNNSGKPVFSIDIPSGWDVESGAPSSGPFFSPDAVISLTAPKHAMKDFKGAHFVGGRFVPRLLIADHRLSLPEYPDSSQIVKISC